MSISLCEDRIFDNSIMENKSNFLERTNKRSDSFSSSEFSFPLFDSTQNNGFNGHLLHSTSVSKPPTSTIDFYSTQPLGNPNLQLDTSPLASLNASEVEASRRPSIDPASNQTELSSLCNLLTLLASSLPPQQRQKLVEKLIQEANASSPSKGGISSFQPWNTKEKTSHSPVTTSGDVKEFTYPLLSELTKSNISSVELCFNDPAKFFFGSGSSDLRSSNAELKNQTSLDAIFSRTQSTPNQTSTPSLTPHLDEAVRSSVGFSKGNGRTNPIFKDFLPNFGQAEGRGLDEQTGLLSNSCSRAAEILDKSRQIDKDPPPIEVGKRSTHFFDLIPSTSETIPAKKEEEEVPTISIAKRGKWAALMDAELPTPNLVTRKSPREIFDVSFDLGDTASILKSPKVVEESFWESVLRSPKGLVFSPRAKLLSPGSIFFTPRNGDRVRSFGSGNDNEGFKVQTSRFAPPCSDESVKSFFSLPPINSSESNMGTRIMAESTCDQKSNTSDLTFDKCVVDSRLTTQMSIEETSVAVDETKPISMTSKPDAHNLFGLVINQAVSLVENSTKKRKTMEMDPEIQSKELQTGHSSAEDLNDYNITSVNNNSSYNNDNGNNDVNNNSVNNFNFSSKVFSSPALSDTSKLENNSNKNPKKEKEIDDDINNEKYILTSRRRELAQNPQAHAARKRRFDVNQRIKNLLDMFPSIRQGDTATMLQEVIENVNGIVAKIKSFTSLEKHENASKNEPFPSFSEVGSNSITKLLTESTDSDPKPSAFTNMNLLAEKLTSNSNLSKRAMHAAKYRLRKKLREAERMNKNSKKGVGSSESLPIKQVNPEILLSGDQNQVRPLYSIGLCLIPKEIVLNYLESNQSK